MVSKLEGCGEPNPCSSEDCEACVEDKFVKTKKIPASKRLFEITKLLNLVWTSCSKKNSGYEPSISVYERSVHNLFKAVRALDTSVNGKKRKR